MPSDSNIAAALADLQNASALIAAATTLLTTVDVPPVVTPPVPAGPVPNGPSGKWVQSFGDEFDGTTLDVKKWGPNWYKDGGVQNNVATYAKNVTVVNSNLVLTLAGSNSGALVHTDISGGYKLPVGGYAEARIKFPGTGTKLYNWPAWWTNSVAGNWPKGGEHDVAEVLSGLLTANYHSTDGANNGPRTAGYWGGAFHTYGVHRKTTSADIWWDGQLVRTYPTNDDGSPQMLILNVGAGTPTIYGTASQVLVDYVRCWTPA